METDSSPDRIPCHFHVEPRGDTFAQISPSGFKEATVAGSDTLERFINLISRFSSPCGRLATWTVWEQAFLLSFCPRAPCQPIIGDRSRTTASFFLCYVSPSSFQITEQVRGSRDSAPSEVVGASHSLLSLMNQPWLSTSHWRHRSPPEMGNKRKSSRGNNLEWRVVSATYCSGGCQLVGLLLWLDRWEIPVTAYAAEDGDRSNHIPRNNSDQDIRGVFALDGELPPT
jgi:hypothetical protein